MKEPDVSILIVNYHCGPFLAGCLASIVRHVRGASFEVIVVDNGSTDDSVAVAQALRLPIRWHCAKENLGFARANNVAAEMARGRYLLLLNPDAELTADCVTPLVQYADAHREIGLLGGYHEDGNGQWQISFGRPIRLQDEVAFALWPKRFLKNLPQTPPDCPQEVGWLAGSFLLVPAELVLEIGLFDPLFFLNDEDIDLAVRIRQAGRKVVFHPIRGFRHYGGVSKSYRSRVLRDHLKARWRYYLKHHGLLPAALYGLCYCGLRGRSVLTSLVKRAE